MSCPCPLGILFGLNLFLPRSQDKNKFLQYEDSRLKWNGSKLGPEKLTQAEEAAKIMISKIEAEKKKVQSSINATEYLLEQEEKR